MKIKGAVLVLTLLAISALSARAQNITAAGSDCTTTNACVVSQGLSSAPSAQAGAVAIAITGTWSATLQFEGSATCNGQTSVDWTAINATPINSTTPATSTTSNGVWQVSVAGLCGFRVRGSAYTSGTATVKITPTTATANKLGGGGGGGGTVVPSAPTTPAFLPQFGSPTTGITNSPLDNGITTAGTVTSSEPIAVSVPSGPPAIIIVDSTNACPAPTIGQTIICSNSTNHGQFSINGGALTTPAGIGTDLGGTNPATTVTGFHFGATPTPLSSTAPSTNQFLKWDGTNIIGATPSGTLPGGAANGNILGVSGGSAAWITTQNLTAKSPSIDPTGSGINGGSPAKCDGSTNDQAALQSVLNTISTNGGGSLRVPNTGSPCLSNDVFYQVITAISSGVPSGTSSCTSAPYCIATATATVASTTGLPPDNAGLVYIDNIPVGSGGTNYNGVFIITGHTGTTFTFQVSSTAGSGDTATPTANSVATVGLYYLGNNLKFDASCAAGNASTCSAFKTTGHAPNLMTYTPNGDHSGPDIRNVSFIGAATTFAGIIVGNTNKFRLDDNAFSGYTGSSGPAAASPWGGVNIGTISGSQCNIVSVCLVSNPWVQFGSIKFNQWGGNLGFSSRGLLSSTIIEGNTTQQANGVNIGTDIGGLQFLNYGNWNPINGGSPDLSGGENFVINDQVQGAAIGALFGGQNNDRIFLKAELNGAGVNRCNHALGSAELCSFGLAIMDTLNSTIFDQSKQLSMGWYIDAQSPGNNVYETNVGGALGTGAAITAASITSNVLTITHASDTSTFAGNSIVLTGMAESFLNNQTVVVLSSGLTSTQFTANFTHANFTNASDTGNITQNAAPTLLSLCSGWNSAAPMTSTCSALTPNYSFQAASNMVDPTVAASTNVYGTPATGAFSPTLNSTFTGNQDAVSTTFQQGFTALAVANFNADAVVNSTGVASGSLPALPSGSILNVANNSTTRATVGAFGNSGRFSTLAAGGTASSPTAVGTTTEVGRFDMFAYNGTAYNPLGGWRMVTAQAQTGSNGGSTLIAQTAPNGTIIPADVLRLEQDGGIDVPGATGGDKGPGTINIPGPFYSSGNISITGAGNAGAFTKELINTSGVANEMVKMDSAHDKAVVITATTDTSASVIGIVSSLSSGNAEVVQDGIVPCIFDTAGVTRADYVQVSTGTAGLCHDAGAVYPTQNGNIAQILTTTASGCNSSPGCLVYMEIDAGGANGTLPVMSSSTKGANLNNTGTASVFEFDPGIDVKAGYGAKGDGSTNDTTAINNAIASCPAAGGVLYFPPGTYEAHGVTLNVANCRLTGANATIQKNANGTLLTISANGVSIDHLILDGVGGTYTGDNILVSAGNNWSITNNVFTNAGTSSSGANVAIDTSSGTPISGWLFQSNKIIETTGNVGLTLRGNLAHGKVLDNTIDLTGNSGNTSGAWSDNIWLGTVYTGISMTDITFSRNTLIEGTSNAFGAFCVESGKFGATADVPTDLHWDNNSCQWSANAGRGGYSFGNGNNLTFTGNTFSVKGFTSAAFDGLEIAQNNFSVFSNNAFDITGNSTGVCVLFDAGGYSNSISGNTCRGVPSGSKGFDVSTQYTPYTITACSQTGNAATYTVTGHITGGSFATDGGVYFYVSAGGGTAVVPSTATVLGGTNDTVTLTLPTTSSALCTTSGTLYNTIAFNVFSHNDISFLPGTTAGTSTAMNFNENSGNAGALVNNSIVSNVISGSTGSGGTTIGIRLGNASPNITDSNYVAENQMAGLVDGILINSGVTNSKIGSNFYFSTGTHVNDSGTNTVTSPDVRAGSWSISSTTSVAVTFGTAFKSAPASCAVTQTGLSASPTIFFGTNTPTETGFTVFASSTGTYSGTYSCQGNPD